MTNHDRAFRIALLAACGMATVSGLRAQCSAGPFIGTPFAMSFAGSVGGYQGSESYHKPVGFAPGNPGAWSGPPGSPRFDFAAAVQSCSGWLTPLPDIDAVSLGRDWILADPATGRVPALTGRWGGLTFSVTPGTNGRPGTALHDESNGRRNAVGGDLFSFILPGSAMPAALVGTTERVFDSREIDTGAVAQDIDAVDHFMALFDSEPWIAPTGPLHWYFSLSQATLGNVHPFVWNGTTPSGATIFEMTLQSNLSWSCPQIWKTYAELGLAATDDIDALAIDEVNQFVLFSTRGTAVDPLMFVSVATDVPIPVPYSDQQGVPISDDIGLINDDDIDAVCAIDPSVRGSAGGLNGMAFAMGTPRPKQFPLPFADLDSSAFRVATPGPADSSYVTFVKGWPATGAGPGIAALFWSLADQPATLVPVVVLNRPLLSPICGAPTSYQIPVPDLLATRGVQVDLRWFVADSALTSIHEAWPIQVRL
ncbi:MAG: hypothetical protein U1F36_14700 [Planctomycetota bacterium]